jgi:thermitase
MHRARAAALACGAVLGLAPAAAQAEPVDRDTVIVRYALGASAQERAAAGRAAGLRERLGAVRGVGAHVVRVTGDPRAVAARLSRSAAVVYAEPNVILRAAVVPDDERFPEQYALDNAGRAGGAPDADIDAPEGWEEAGLGGFPATGGVKVGIVDTGVDAGHPDLAGKIEDCAAASDGVVESDGCADDNDHGTHVSGTIAAVANNGIGIAGVAFDSPLGHCRALFGPRGVGSTAEVANCIAHLAEHGAKVISMSLGGPPSTTLREAVESAYANGAGSLLVAAAGNEGDSTATYPAAYPEVVSVAATDRADRRAPFSNANADVEVAAPGVDILSTVRGGGYAELSGTSMAAPHAAGVAAQIWSRDPGLSAAEVRARLDAAVDDLGEPGRDSSFGYGRVNLALALP